MIRGRRVIRGRRAAEHGAVLALGLLVLAVHDVGYMLRQPFWIDEAWVAVTTRFPLSQLPATTDATPIGWSALMRLLTVRGEQTSRLLPLAFAGAAVVVAYWFGRRLGWRRREVSVLGGALAGIAVLLVPAMLVRDDLKQYTADACLALLVLALTSRLERQWSRPGLLALSAAAWAGMLFSEGAAFAGMAAFAAVCLIQLARGDWRRLAEAAAVGAGTAIGMLGVYEVFMARAVAPALTAYWSKTFLPVGGGLRAGMTFIGSHFIAAGPSFGLGPAWLALPLVLAGLVTIVRLGRPATALTIAVLWLEMLAVSAARMYPFLNVRTSTFLFAVTAAVAAIGVAGVCSLLRPWFRGALAAGLAAVAVAAFAVQAQPYLRSHLIKTQDVRDQARYVAAHAAPGDVIMVNMYSDWAFAYYWPGSGVLARRADPPSIVGYAAYFRDDPDIVIVDTWERDQAGTYARVSRALDRWHGCGRLWLVGVHVTQAEQRAVTTAVRRRKLTLTPISRDGLGVIQAGGTRHLPPGQVATAKTDCPNGAPHVPSKRLRTGTTSES